jgi:hypothetical protein
VFKGTLLLLVPRTCTWYEAWGLGLWGTFCERSKVLPWVCRMLLFPLHTFGFQKNITLVVECTLSVYNLVYWPLSWNVPLLSQTTDALNVVSREASITLDVNWSSIILLCNLRLPVLRSHLAPDIILKYFSHILCARRKGSATLTVQYCISDDGSRITSKRELWEVSIASTMRYFWKYDTVIIIEYLFYIIFATTL